MPHPSTYIGLRGKYDALPQEVRDYFEHLPLLLTNQMPYEVPLAYLFGRVERAHNMTLYCGIVRSHRTDSKTTLDVVSKEFITRKKFSEYFKSIFGVQFDQNVRAHITAAEKARDKAIHGKNPTDKEMRDAISGILDYAPAFNTFVDGVGGLKPFGSLQGFSGRAEKLGNPTTILVLKGLGFSI
jgi:hypothetical protein